MPNFSNKYVFQNCLDSQYAAITIFYVLQFSICNNSIFFMLHQTCSPSFNISESTNFESWEKIYVQYEYFWIKYFAKTTIQKSFKKDDCKGNTLLCAPFVSQTKKFRLNLPHEQLQILMLLWLYSTQTSCILWLSSKAILYNKKYMYH